MTERFAYDEVPYDSEANADAHPSLLAAIARLCGLDPALPSKARVLEMGCGNGESLLAMAPYLPDAKLVGFDLAASAIALGRARAPANVDLFQADLTDVTLAKGAFDYVIAHGVYSWVPPVVRPHVLRQMRDALTPNGVGFLSINALPGWELRRTLRSLARHLTKADPDPRVKVEKTLAFAEMLAEAGEGERGFAGALASSARAYRAHVAQATPPDAPYARYVFHDLIADHNEAFSVGDLAKDLEAAGLKLVCEVPLRRGRAADFAGVPTHSTTSPLLAGLEGEMELDGTPFLQALVVRAEANPEKPSGERVADMLLWADLEPTTAGSYRTTTGAVLRIPQTHILARAADRAPGFIPVAEITDDPNVRAGLVTQLFEAFVAGVLTLVVEAPAVAIAPARPKLAEHARRRLEAAIARASTSCVITNALHRSFEIPAEDLAILASFDGTHEISEPKAKRVFDKYRRYLFFQAEAR